MAKNEVLVHIDDKQISDLKRSNKQDSLRVVNSIEKLQKQVEMLSKRINYICGLLEINNGEDEIFEGKKGRLDDV